MEVPNPAAQDQQLWHPPTPEAATPVSAVAEIQQTPADKLGLTDGAFLVHRSDGTIENGWTAEGIGVVTNKETGVKETAVKISKPTYDEKGTVIGHDVTAVLQDELLSWQQQPDDSEVELFTAEDLKADMEQLRQEMLDARIGKSALQGEASLPPQVQQEVVTAHESLLDERQKHIFAPHKEVKQTTEVNEDEHWDAFLLTDAEYQQKHGKLPKERSVEEAAVRDESNINRQVTESSTEYAAMALQGNIDPGIKQIIAKFSEGTKDIDSLIVQVRENPQLREELASYFLDKISKNVSDMPERIARNTQKKPGHKGYEQIGYMTSREYASLMAISMLDGTFKFETANSDPIVRAKDGSVEVGQHRSAAEALLYW